MASKRKLPKIGARWAPGQRVTRGTNGTFEAVNELDLSRDAVLIQRALLRPTNHKPNWPGVGLLLYVLLGVVAVAGVVLSRGQ